VLHFSTDTNAAMVFAVQAFGLGPDAARVLGDQATALLVQHTPTQFDDPSLVRTAIRQARRRSACT
jgi:hypothetical protein